jgi:hypothetical protein
MTLQFQEPIHWRPALEVLLEDEAVEILDVQLLLSENAQILYRLSPSLFSFDSYDQWKTEQENRSTAPIGSRVLLRRRLIHVVIDKSTYLVHHDIMMERTERWNNYHVVYFEQEPSPMPQKKRTGYSSFCRGY